MNLTPQDLRAAQKAHAQALAALAQVQIHCMEKWMLANASTARGSLEQSLAYGRSLLGATNVEELVAAHVCHARPAWESGLASSRALQEIASEVNADLARATSAWLQEWRKSAVLLMESMASAGPERAANGKRADSRARQAPAAEVRSPG